jgi:mannose-6-phosphate isomerase-like protein (cupin superfamily)
MTSLSELSRTQSIRKVQGRNFTAAYTGRASDLHQYAVEHPRLNRRVVGKLFLKDHLNLTSMQVSLNKLRPGAAVPFYHAHKNNEELYIFTGGSGQMQIDDQLIDVQEGTVIRIAPAGWRTWRNNSCEDLYYIVLQAKDGSLDNDTFDDGIPSEKPVTWSGETKSI